MKKLLVACAGLAVVAACSDSSSSPRSLPTVTATVSANPFNSLSLLVDVQATNADSIRVLSLENSARRVVSPFTQVTGLTARIPVLGLKRLTPYSLVVEAVGSGGTTTSQPVSSTTGDLPQSLKNMSLATVTGVATRGYVYFTTNLGTSAFAIAFDSAGTIAWYREFTDARQALALSQQPNGNFTLFLGESRGWEPTPGDFVEFTPAGNEVRRWSAPSGFYTDGHELLLTSEGGQTTGHLFGYTLRTVDARSVGGSATESLAQHTIHRVRQGGAAELVWDSWQVFTIADWIEPPHLTLLDIDHPNSLFIADDGHYIVSWRNAGEVTKINRTSGQIIWRLGGRNNQFQIIGDPLGKFSAQHYAQMTPQGTLLIYDNGTRHSPSQSRAVEYRLDETAKTATLVREFRHSPALFTPFVGSVQRLDNLNTLVGWGWNSLVTEYSATGGIVWEGRVLVSGAPIQVYRLLKAYSLYAFSTP